MAYPSLDRFGQRGMERDLWRGKKGQFFDTFGQGASSLWFVTQGG